MSFWSRIWRSTTECERDVWSPNKRLMCKFLIEHGKISYEVRKDGQKLVKNSRMGLEIAGEKEFDRSLSLIREHRRSFDKWWETKWGEEKNIRNQYNEAAFYLAEKAGDKRLVTIRVRVFDEGVAFRYELPPQPKFQQITILREKTEFNIDVNAYAWQIPAYQPDRYEYNYDRTPVYELKQAVHTPLTIEMIGGQIIALHEAALYDYGAMTVKLNERGVLQADITSLSDGTAAHVALPFMTPWRVLMVADTMQNLVLNRMVLNLNEPPKLNFDWVKPMKFMGIWWAMFVGEWTWAPGERHGATTEHATEYINACKRLGVKGLLVEGWNNGWEGNWLLAGADSNFTQPMADFDLPKIAAYAKLNGVELVGHHETVGYIDNYENQIEAAYQYYRQNGISYVKSGYAGSMMTVNGRKEFHHSQVGVHHYQRAVELAAKHGIMLNVHEPIKGTGIERTWPNLLTREGARGQEYEGGALFPSHVCILPFTRLLAGGMDYTSGIFDVTNGTKRIASTVARQLALYVVIYSGMQMAADRPRFYEQNFPEMFEFIRQVPVSFERTVPLLAAIGQFYVVARQGRDSEDWYIGGVTNEEGRTVHVQMDFLIPGARYELTIYADSEDAHYRENQLGHKIERRTVQAGEAVPVWMAPGGGVAMWVRRV